jgi:hypothetical protein
VVVALNPAVGSDITMDFLHNWAVINEHVVTYHQQTLRQASPVQTTIGP